MKLLIVAATKNEIEPLLKQEFKNHTVDFLITGVGMVATAHALSKKLTQNNFDFAINMGIAGAFHNKTTVVPISIGSVFQVIEDCFSELGAEDNESFISFEDLGFGVSKFRNNYRVKKPHLPLASSITVNTVHGNSDSIEKIVNRLNPDLESMEGAAFAYCCEQVKVNYIQIRAVSNYVESRDKSKWNIPLAIENLNKTVIDIIESL